MDNVKQTRKAQTQCTESSKILAVVVVSLHSLGTLASVVHDVVGYVPISSDSVTATQFFFSF